MAGRIGAAVVALALFCLAQAAVTAAAEVVHDRERVARASTSVDENPLIAPPAVCPGQNRVRGSAATQERAMLCLIDHARRATSRASLTASDQLRGSADAKSGDILGCDQFDHYACGRTFDHWIRASGYLTEGCWRIGENIAWGRGALGTARAIFVALMASPSHRENILLPEFVDIGVAVESGGLSGMNGVRVWTQHFGLHCD